jgi:MOSC domain-containing protein YiiM
MARLLSVNVGLPRDIVWRGTTVHTGVAYQIESPLLAGSAPTVDFVHGQFGENFTVEGLPDNDVYVGDRYRIGGALFEVAQPRVTSYRVGIRMNEPRMAAFLTSSGRPGFYFRVLEEGRGRRRRRDRKGHEGKEQMSVAEVNALLYSPQHPRDRLERASQIAALSPGWRASFIALLGSRSDASAGLAPASAAHPAAPGT